MLTRQWLNSNRFAVTKQFTFRYVIAPTHVHFGVGVAVTEAVPLDGLKVQLQKLLKTFTIVEK